MRIVNIVVLIGLAGAASLAGGCHMGRTTGTTLLGTGVGAGVGAIAGGSKGTAIGAGVGALSGFLIGAYEDKREQRMMQQGYAPVAPVVVHEHHPVVYEPPVLYERPEPVIYERDPEYEEFLRWKAERAASPTP
jgi:hypothetical protein